MKKKFYFILIGIMFPVLMNAQLNLIPHGEKMSPQFSMQNQSKITSPVLFPFALSGFYRQDFDGAVFPPAGWQVIDVLNPVYTWQASNLFAYNGVQSAYISYAATEGEDWLILPKFTIAAGDSFSFWLALQNAGWPPDSTFILVSNTDSALSSFTSVLGTLAEGYNYPTVSNTYQYHSFELSAYAGSDIYVAIKNKNTNGDGVLIDRLEIGTRPTINASVLSIDLDKCIQTGATVSPSAIVLNDGNTVQSFPVTMTTTGGYSSVQNVTNLAPGGSQLLTFDPWTTPVVPATETVSVQTQLAGDGYQVDDSLIYTVKVLEPFTNFGWSTRAPISPAKFDIPLASFNTNDTSYLFTMGGNTGGSAFTNAARKYLPYSNSWTTIPNMPLPAGYACGATYNNKVYVIGGYTTAANITNVNRIYDLSTGSWSLGTPAIYSLAMNAIGVYHDSLFYFIGGRDLLNVLNGVQIYNAASDSWSFGINLPVARGLLSGGISGNKIVVSAGADFSGIYADTYVGEIDPTDPSIITWTQVDDYPAGACQRLGGGASLDESSGLIVFTGGALNSSVPIINSKYTFAYDVNTNQWKIGPPKPTLVRSLMNLAAVVDNDSLYMVSVGGNGSTGSTNVNEWLNMGPYQMPVGIADINTVKASFTSYPNPFANVIDIKFSISQSSTVKVIISDVIGQEVEVLCNKNLATGTQQLKWDATKYANGIYFCKLIINGSATTQKLVKYE